MKKQSLLKSEDRFTVRPWKASASAEDRISIRAEWRDLLIVNRTALITCDDLALRATRERTSIIIEMDLTPQFVGPISFKASFLLNWFSYQYFQNTRSINTSPCFQRILLGMKVDLTVRSRQQQQQLISLGVSSSSISMFDVESCQCYLLFNSFVNGLDFESGNERKGTLEEINLHE